MSVITTFSRVLSRVMRRATVGGLSVVVSFSSVVNFITAPSLTTFIFISITATTTAASIVCRSRSTTIPPTSTIANMDTSSSTMLFHRACAPYSKTRTIVVILLASVIGPIYHIRIFSSSSSWRGASRAWWDCNFIDEIAHVWRNRRGRWGDCVTMIILICHLGKSVIYLKKLILEK